MADLNESRLIDFIYDEYKQRYNLPNTIGDEQRSPITRMGKDAWNKLGAGMIFSSNEATKAEERGPQLIVGKSIVFVAVPKPKPMREDMDMVQLTEAAMLKEYNRPRKIRQLRLVKGGKESKIKDFTILAGIFEDEGIDAVSYFQDNLEALRSFLTVYLNFSNSLSAHEYYASTCKEFGLVPSEIAPRIQEGVFTMNFYRNSRSPEHRLGHVILITNVSLDLGSFVLKVNEEYEVHRVLN